MIDLVKFLVCHVDVPCWHTKQRAHVRGNIDDDDDDDNSDGNNHHYHFGDKITHIFYPQSFTQFGGQYS